MTTKAILKADPTLYLNVAEILKTMDDAVLVRIPDTYTNETLMDIDYVLAVNFGVTLEKHNLREFLLPKTTFDLV